jgi:hypothetical protein
MCDFISWVDIDGVVFFITDKELRTKRGRDLMKYSGWDTDVIGHGFIREYYELPPGAANSEWGYHVNKRLGNNCEINCFIEYMDRFPEEIQKAFKYFKQNFSYILNEPEVLSNRCRKDEFDEVKFLVENGAELNPIKSYSVPIVSACNYEHVIQYLLDNGANINLATDSGMTVLSRSYGYRDRDRPEFLIDRGAKLGRKNYLCTSVTDIKHYLCYKYIVRPTKPIIKAFKKLNNFMFKA